MCPLKYALAILGTLALVLAVLAFRPTGTYLQCDENGVTAVARGPLERATPNSTATWEQLMDGCGEYVPDELLDR